MSYILDALRRADAERERGSVPGLHSANLAGPASTPAAEATAPVAAASPVPSPPPTIVVVPMPAPPPAVAPSTAAAMPQPQPQLQSQSPQAATAVAGADAIAPPGAPAPAAGAVRVDTRPPDATGTEPPALPLAQLSAEQRRQWPALTMGGSIWSDNPAQRFVIANGQVLREGETAAPGVVVDRIEARRVLLRWQGLRVEVPL
jgi:general secretion pathway protein B